MNRTRAVLALAISVAAATQPAAGQSASAVFDDTGLLIGLWAGTGVGAGAMDLHSVRGFRFGVGADGLVDIVSGDIGGNAYSIFPWYATADCTGPAYLVVTGGFLTTGRLPGGVVTRLRSASAPLVYVPKAPMVANITVRAYMQGAACIAQQPADLNVVEFLPNDPAVTGVPNSDFSPPLRLEVVPLSAVINLFSDGFESATAQS